MSKEANIWNRVNSAWREIVDSTTIALNLTPGEASFSVKPGSLSISAGTEAAIIWVVDSGLLDMTTGLKGFIEVPFDCEIIAGSLLADQTGSVTVDIWVDTFTNAPPDNSDSITASAPLSFTGNVKVRDTTLTGWDTALTAGDIIAFNIDSVSGIHRLVITLTVTRTLVND